MDKHGKRFFEDVDEPTRVIDLKEEDIKDEWEEDIDTIDEETEAAEKNKVDEPTKVIEEIPSDKGSDKNGKEKKSKDKKLKEKTPKEKKKKDTTAEDRESEKEKKQQERLKEKNEKKLDRLMKKKQRREKSSDRDVLSYEDMPLEEREERAEKKTHSIDKKRIIAVVLIMLVLFGIVFVFANADKLSWHNIRNYVKYGILNQRNDEHFPVSIQGENVDVGNFSRMGQDICYASDTKLQIINNYGRTEYSTQHGFTNPVLKTSDQYALIFSLGGSGFQINSYEKTLFSSQTEDRILTADIIDKGTYALVTTSTGYLSKLQVYNKDNEKIFGYSFADYYVTAVSLAPNGKNAVVTGISAHNGSEIASIYVLDFTKDKPAYLEEIGENIFYDVQYLNDTYACAVGNAAVCTVNTRNGEVNTTGYEGKDLTAYCFNTDTDNFSISLSRSGDGRNCQILSFKTDGQLSDSFDTDYMVKYISTYKGRVALLTPDVIYLYSKSGSLESKKEVSNEPRAVVLYTSSDAYVLDTNEISSLTI